MKPVFKCEYCNFMGTEEEVAAHEDKCYDNYDRKSCMTCKYRKYKNMNQFGCDVGKEIPEGQMFEFCDKYERKEKSNNPMSDLFGGLFGL